jgi:ribosome-associated protein
VRDTLVIADFFVIVTGQNRRQIQAMADEMGRALKTAGVYKRSVDGYEAGRWVLIDFDEVVVHLFSEEAREYYRLELLWEDAPRVDWPAEVKAAAEARARRVGR